MQLNETQADLLKEAFNLGVGRAAVSLSELAGGEEIELSVPEVHVITIKELESFIVSVSGEDICGVGESFSGPFTGKAMMLYSQEESLELVRIMLGGIIPLEELSEMEGEALCEVGNVVLNAIISTLANLFQAEIQTDLPILRKGACREVLEIEDAEHSDVLYLRMKFQVARHNLSGHIGFFMDISSAQQLAVCLDDYFKRMMSV